MYKAKRGAIEVAVKELKCDHSTSANSSASKTKFREFNHEVAMMRYVQLTPYLRFVSQVSHINLVSLFGITANPLAMVLEFCPKQSLSYHLYHNNDFIFTSKLKTKISVDLARGLECLHSLVPPIIHRDVRSPNVFVRISVKIQSLHFLLFSFPPLLLFHLLLLHSLNPPRCALSTPKTPSVPN